MKNGTFTDWQDLITRQGSLVEHRLGVQGGNDRAQYAVSGELQKQIGVVMSQGVRSQADARQHRGPGEGSLPHRRLGALRPQPAEPSDATTGCSTRPSRTRRSACPTTASATSSSSRRRTPSATTRCRTSTTGSNDTQRNRIFGTLFATVNLISGSRLPRELRPGHDLQPPGHLHRRADPVKQGAGNQSEMREQRTFDYTLDNLLTYKRDSARSTRSTRRCCTRSRRTTSRSSGPAATTSRPSRSSTSTSARRRR